MNDKAAPSWSLLFLSTLLIIAFYTQWTHTTEVPGLHFDEAWQGHFAHRIASEPNFWPYKAMNGYTSPIVHYLLAFFFKIFGPKIEVMRSLYALLNILSLLIFISLFLKFKKQREALWFTTLWAVLPLSIHNHRFYIELTGFHGFCLALFFLGLALWKTYPIFSSLTIVSSLTLGTYSHILFIVIFLSSLVVLPQFFSKEFQSMRARVLVAVISVLVLPITLRMGYELKKIQPFFLGCTLILMGLLSGCSIFINKIYLLYCKWPQLSKKLMPWFFLGAFPFLIGFILLHWNGVWPYAQVTGKLKFLWLPLNGVLFLGLLWKFWGLRSPAANSKETNLFFWLFITSFLFVSILSFKQSPRYYMIPLLIAFIWCAQGLAQIKNKKRQLFLGIAVITWNLFLFQAAYLIPFQRNGATTLEFKFGLYHDNSRDFRPFQKVFRWAVENNCQDSLKWVEDDRFLLPIEFLRLDSPAVDPKKQKCPWRRDQLFFSHIPNYQENFMEMRTPHNTPPPVENVKFLLHRSEWGDLALWIRR